MKQKNGQPETIHCDQCGRPAASTSGHFLRSVLVLCGDCRTLTKWHVDKKGLDAIKREGVKAESQIK